MKNFGSNVVYLNLKFVEDCVNVCLFINKFFCNSFDFCLDFSKCYFSSWYILMGK